MFQKKYSEKFTWTVYVIFTAVIVAALMALPMKSSSYGNGNGLFVFGGPLYLIPMKLLYDQPLKYTISTICSSWIYTMAAFSLAMRISSFLIPNISP